MSEVETASGHGLRAWIMHGLTLAGFGVIGWWGHETHWKFLPHADHPPQAEAHAPAHAAPHAPQASQPATAARDDQPGLEIVPAAERSFQESVRAHGVVTYDSTRVAQLASRVRGTVWRVYSKVGDHVRQGDVLALVDSAEVGAAKANYLSALVHAELKEKTLHRLEGLDGVVSERHLHEARAAHREARVGLFNAQQALCNLGLPVNEQQLQDATDEERAARIQFLGLPGFTLATLDPKTASANLIPLIASFDGTVIRQEIVRGEVVEPTSVQIVLADVDRMWLQLDIRKEDALQVAIGQEVAFQTEGLPGEVRSPLTWISTEVDEKTRTIQARAEVENPLIGTHDGQRRLRANMFGSAEIFVRPSARGVAVPSAAVQWAETGYLVFIAGPGGCTPREVRTGLSRDGWTEIIAGLAPGERVVAQGSHTLKMEYLRTRLAERERAAQQK